MRRVRGDAGPSAARRIGFGLLAVSIVSLSEPAGAQAPRAGAHAVPMSERVEARLALIKEAGAKARPGENAQYSIDGAMNPELLLPSEVFQYLLTAAANEDSRFRSNFRYGLEEESTVELDFSSFWNFIDEACSRVGAISEERRVASLRGGPGDEEKAAALSKRECNLRVRLLREAAREFGDAELHSLLYETIAPQMSFVGLAPVDLPAERARLLWMEAGCQ